MSSPMFSGKPLLCVSGTAKSQHAREVEANRNPAKSSVNQRPEAKTATELYRAEVQRLANDRRCGYEEAWRLCQILAPELYSAFLAESSEIEANVKTGGFSK
jgi:hypothetical protein